MLLRYSSSVAAGSFVTLALIYSMDSLIAGSDIELEPKQPFRFVSLVRITPPPPTRPPPERHERPEPADLPPATTSLTVNPTTVQTGLIGPVTPPGPDSPPGQLDGLRGPWPSDAEVIQVAGVRPNYPQAAIARELEGSVVVEFTVNRQGRVEDVVVVSSTHRVFENSAVAAVGRYRYQPRIVDGVAVDVPGVRQEISFRLED